jgi:hypothetical protein
MKPCANHPALKTRIRKGFAGRKDDPWAAVFSITSLIAKSRPSCAWRYQQNQSAVRIGCVADFRKLWKQANPINRSGMAATLHQALGTGRDQAWNNAIL